MSLSGMAGVAVPISAARWRPELDAHGMFVPGVGMSHYDDPDPSVAPEAEALLEALRSPWAPPLLHLEQLRESIRFFRGQLTTKDDAEHLALHGYLLHDRPDETWLGRLLGRLYPVGPEPTYTLVPKPRPVLAEPDEPDDDWGPPTPGERRSPQPDVEDEKRWNPTEPFPFLSADVAATLVGARPDRLERRRNMLDVIATGLRHAQARRPGKVSLLRDSLQALCGKCDVNQISLLLQADAAYLNIDDRVVTPRDPTIGPWFGGLSFDILVAVYAHVEAQTRFFQQVAEALDVGIDGRSFPRSDPRLGSYVDAGSRRLTTAAVLLSELSSGALALWGTSLAEVAGLVTKATRCSRPRGAGEQLDLRVVTFLADSVLLNIVRGSRGTLGTHAPPLLARSAASPASTNANNRDAGGGKRRSPTPARRPPPRASETPQQPRQVAQVAQPLRGLIEEEDGWYIDYPNADNPSVERVGPLPAPTDVGGLWVSTVLEFAKLAPNERVPRLELLKRIGSRSGGNARSGEPALLSLLKSAGANLAKDTNGGHSYFWSQFSRCCHKGKVCYFLAAKAHPPIRVHALQKPKEKQRRASGSSA